MTTPAFMQALRLEAPGELREVTVATPTPGPREILIETGATTICTSDLHDIDRNPFEISLPRILGHEGAGWVRAMGEEVSGFSPGDRVACHPVIPCHTCANCTRGLLHLCRRMGHLGIDRDGTFAEFFTVPAERVRRIPDDLPLAVAALLEPAAVCLEAIARARLLADQSLLVAGDGPFGLLIARLAARRTKARVILSGRHPFRISKVPEAEWTLDEDPAKSIHTIRAWSSDGEGVEAAILAVGSADALNVCLASLRARGRLVLFSAIHDAPRVDLFRVHLNELEVVGACNDEEFLDDALYCLSDPKLSMGELITHEFPLYQWERAFDLARAGKDRALKVALTFERSR